MNELTFSHGRVDGPDAGPIAGDVRTREDLPLVMQLLRVLKRRKWLILGSVIMAGIVGLIATLLMTPLYTAEATLEIQRENLNIVKVEGVEPEGSSVDLEFYQTQYGLLRSQTLAERVATEMRLHEDANFFEMFGEDKIATEIRESGRRTPTATVRQDRIRKAGEILIDNLAVSPIRLSRLVDVKFTSPDAQFSARMLNAWTRNFIATTLERKFEATSYARRFLEDRLEQTRRRLEQSERQLVSYAANQRIINLPSSTTQSEGGEPVITERPLVADDLASLNRELNEATAARVAAGSRLQSVGGSTSEALQNAAISRLRERRAELAADRARILTQFDSGYPPAQALAQQIADIDRSIVREESRVGSTLRGTYEASVARENALRGRVQELQGNLLDLRRRTIQYNIYQRDVDTNRQLYDGLLQRYKEIGVAGGVGVNNVAVVDPARTPQEPSSPNLLRNLLLSLLLGGVVGAGLAFAREQIDEAISDPSDVERALGLPLLGAIPRSHAEDPRSELDDPKSPLVEAYLSTQTTLSFATEHGIPHTLAVTSTRPGEGKTTTSYALARSLARTGRTAILIDADMRSPSLHQIFGVKNSRGLSNYLSSGAQAVELVHPPVNGLAFMSAGPTPPNAAELLTGGRVTQLLAELRSHFDHVVLDLPPVMGLADTPIVSSQVEGVVFVIESHQTKASMARVAVGRLRNAQARVFGALLTKFEARRAHYGYGYDYGYGYGRTGDEGGEGRA